MQIDEFSRHSCWKRVKMLFDVTGFRYYLWFLPVDFPFQALLMVIYNFTVLVALEICNVVIECLWALSSLRNPKNAIIFHFFLEKIWRFKKFAIPLHSL